MNSPDDLWSDGYVIVPRRLLPKAGHRGPHAWDSDKPARESEARLDLWGMANHDNRNGLHRGCCDPSLDFLAQRWNWDRSKVVRFLQRLERDMLIVREKRTGSKRTVTRFLAYDRPSKADTSAIQRKHRSRYKESQSPKGFPGIARHSPPMRPDTVPEPNRTKRVALARKEEGYQRKKCPECWDVEIDADKEVCNRCLGLPDLRAEIDAWQPEGGVQ